MNISMSVALSMSMVVIVLSSRYRIPGIPTATSVCKVYLFGHSVHYLSARLHENFTHVLLFRKPLLPVVT